MAEFVLPPSGPADPRVIYACKMDARSPTFANGSRRIYSGLNE